MRAEARQGDQGRAGRRDAPAPWRSALGRLEHGLPAGHSAKGRRPNALATRVEQQAHERWWVCALAAGKRRYDRKQSGYGGQTKPVFHKKAKTTKKIVLRLQCNTCKTQHMHAIKVRAGPRARGGRGAGGAASCTRLEAAPRAGRGALVALRPGRRDEGLPR